MAAGPCDTGAPPPVIYRFADLVLDPARRELTRRGRPVRLSARAFDCLVHLIEHRDREVTRDELIAALFGRGDVADSQLARLLLRVRQVVGDDGIAQRHVRTVPGVGFRWVSPVAVAHAAPAPGPHPPAAARPRRFGLAAAGALCAALALALAGALAWRSLADEAKAPQAQAPASAPHRALVLPVRVEGGPRDGWLRLGLMDVLADRLRRAGLPVLPSETALALLARERAAEADVAPGRRFAGTAARAADGGWRVVVRTRDADGITLRGEAVEADPVAAARLAGDRLLATLGRAPPHTPAGHALALDERVHRAQAAMLANELDAARALLRASPEYRRGDPEVRFRLLQVDYRAGDYEAVLAGARALLDEAGADGDASLRGRAHAARGATRIRLARYAEAEADFDAAVALLDPTRHPLELAQTLNGRGSARMLRGELDGALDDLGRSRFLAALAHDPVGEARAEANLGHVEQRRGRLLQATGHFERAAAEFEALGALNELVSVRLALIDTHLQLLRPDRALQLSERTRALWPRIEEQAQRNLLNLLHAQALARHGRLPQARRLASAPPADAAPASEVQRYDYAQTEIDLALRAHRPADALRLADAALARWPDGPPAFLDWVSLRRAQAALVLRAPASPAAPAGPARAATVPGLLRQAIGLRRAGAVADAERAYRGALALAGESGVPRLLAEAALAYAPWLIERGRLAEATEVAGRVAPWAEHDHDLGLLLVRLHQAMPPMALPDDDDRAAHGGPAGRATLPDRLAAVGRYQF
ncbi:winged helix-turn-helix domain-containing protein [Luteimonas sp. Y-2-2-4F]|nr:winged helix-turn-helix domain-containing protein [Luteimonas sp. Y-2-2-4F]MCD9032771.1 winged helix-turn-helix domain-containing protein [Luteimonas sp. Y-2-2-4F]